MNDEQNSIGRSQAEPEGQRLFAIYTLLEHTHVDGYTTRALPCLNHKQFAAKVNTKGQQALDKI